MDFRPAAEAAVLLQQLQKEKPSDTATKKAARKILDSNNATATAVFEAVKVLLGFRVLAWEPESVWLDLQDKQIDLSLTNRDKFLAVSTLVQAPTLYYTDGAIYENTSLAFNNTPSAPDAIQEASPAQLAWAVYEAEILVVTLVGAEPEFDHEPTRYAAISMHRAGFVIAPEQLAFAQEELDKFNRGTTLELRAAVVECWEGLNRSALEGIRFGADPVGVQMANLAAVHLYIRSQTDRHQRELRTLVGV